MKYFSNIPLIDYNNNLARNILSRVKISNHPYYYPYVLDEQRKIEHVAHDYYQDIDDVWILHHINNTIDPYFDYALSQTDFNKYIEKKYGSVYKAQRDIIFYHNNYVGDDTSLDTVAFHALPTKLKKYWSPVLDVTGNPYEYTRVKDDIIISTNKIISMNIALSDTSLFLNGEKVLQTGTGAYGFSTFCNSSVVILQHISGAFNTSTLTGEDSEITATVTDVSTISQPISDVEAVYFSPVSFYEYEDNINEQKRSINILDKNYAESVSSQFRQQMQNG
jgi:hypothetical protein